MRAGRDEHLRPSEALGEGFGFGSVEVFFQARQIVRLFLDDVLGQFRHEGFERGFEGRVVGREGLEFVEGVLDL